MTRSAKRDEKQSTINQSINQKIPCQTRCGTVNVSPGLKFKIPSKTMVTPLFIFYLCFFSKYYFKFKNIRKNLRKLNLFKKKIV